MEQECSEFSEFTESNKSLEQFVHYVSHMCFAGTVVASWFLTQEVAGYFTNEGQSFTSHYKNRTKLINIFKPNSLWWIPRE